MFNKIGILICLCVMIFSSCDKKANDIYLFIDSPKELDSCINSSELNKRYRSILKSLNNGQNQKFTVLSNSNQNSFQQNSNYLILKLEELGSDSITLDLELVTPENEIKSRYGKTKRVFSCSNIQETICKFYLKYRRKNTAANKG